MSAWANKAKLAQITSPNQNQIHNTDQDQLNTTTPSTPSQNSNINSSNGHKSPSLQSQTNINSSNKSSIQPTKPPINTSTNQPVKPSSTAQTKRPQTTNNSNFNKQRQIPQHLQNQSSQQNQQHQNQVSQNPATKQNSTQIALQKPQSQLAPSLSSENAFDCELNKIQQGSQIKLITSLNETITGRVYCYEKSLNALLLQIDSLETSQQTDSRDYTIINISHLKHIEISDSMPLQIDNLQTLNYGISIAREDKAISDRLIESQKIAPFTLNSSNNSDNNSIQVAQRIFDACNKTLPCVWENQVIIVMNSIQIHPPYTIEKINGNNKSQISRVSKIVEAEWKKIKQETSKE